MLADDLICDWPLTRERIRSRENYIALNEAYPGKWTNTVEELIAAGDRVVTRCRLEWNDEIVYGISFFTVLNGQVTHEVDWWPVPYDPPPGRERWTEPMPPDEIPITP